MRTLRRGRRESVEAALGESEARFRAVFEAAAVGIALVGLDGRWHKANPRLCAMLGYTEDELTARQFQELTHPDDVEPNLELLRRVLAGGTPSYSLEKRYLRKDGTELWTFLTAALVRDAAGQPNYFIAIVTDISERKAAEQVLARDRAQLELLVEERTAALLRAAEDRRRAEEALRQGEKLQAVGQLTGGIAHDLNNFLQVIGSGAQLLRRPGLTEERRTAVLDGITKAIQNAAGLTSRLLAFARKQPLRPETIDLSATLRDMAGMLRHTLGRRAMLHTEIAPELWSVRVDPQQLEIAILNLAVNARDAMPEQGGVLTISAHNTVLGLSPPEAGTSGEYVDLILADNGEGMSPAVLGRVFEPFFTTKGADKGTGLGLAQVHGFVKQSGGDIFVDSAPGAGTRVTLRLRRAPEMTPHGTDAPDVPGLMRRAAGKTVLVVDDNEDITLFACAMLAELGYTTTRAANAEQALETLNKGAPVDAVFSDIVMPGAMNGIELAIRLGESHPGVAVVLASGYSDMLANWQGKLDWEVLTKPYRLDELGAALERAIAR